MSKALVLAEHAGHAGALSERWPYLPLERRRVIIAAVLDSVVTGPAAAITTASIRPASSRSGAT